MLSFHVCYLAYVDTGFLNLINVVKYLLFLYICNIFIYATLVE